MEWDGCMPNCSTTASGGALDCGSHSEMQLSQFFEALYASVKISTEAQKSYDSIRA